MEDKKNTELTDDALDSVAGGRGQYSGCPDCGSTKPRAMMGNDYVCPDCGHVFFTIPSFIDIVDRKRQGN